ncbi:MAG: spermidine synthase, partial [Rhodothermales bacterium]
SLWTTELHEMLLVGSLEPLELDVPRISERFNQPQVIAALREVGIATPEALLGTWVTDRAGLETYAADALPVTDDRPRIEYADWVRYDEIHRVLPALIGLRTSPPLSGADDAFVRAVAQERQRLMLFYQAALNGSAGNRELWVRDMRSVLQADGSNAYYRWFDGSGN